MQEIWVPSLCQEDFLEEEMATHSRIFAEIIPWTEEPGGLQSITLQSQTWLMWLSTHSSVNLTVSELRVPITIWQRWKSRYREMLKVTMISRGAQTWGLFSCSKPSVLSQLLCWFPLALWLGGNHFCFWTSMAASVQWRDLFNFLEILLFL